jgi:hypothetical protein
MKIKLVWLALVLAFADPCPTSAALLRAMPIAELAAKSDVVLQGTVTSTTTQRDSQGSIVTYVTLRIAEVWKGNIDTNTFRIVHSGGVLGEEVQMCSAQVEYRIGEEVVAMLVLNQRGEGVTLGLLQGKFEVEKDSKTGDKTARNLFHGNTSSDDAHGHGNSSKAANGAPAEKKKLGLAEFKQQVQGGAK